MSWKGIPVGNHDGSHWTLNGEPHFTRPDLKPVGMGYTWFGARQGYGGLEQQVIKSTVEMNNSLYPKPNLERFTALDPFNGQFGK